MVVRYEFSCIPPRCCGSRTEETVALQVQIDTRTHLRPQTFGIPPLTPRIHFNESCFRCLWRVLLSRQRSSTFPFNGCAFAEWSCISDRISDLRAFRFACFLFSRNRRNLMSRPNDLAILNHWRLGFTDCLGLGIPCEQTREALSRSRELRGDILSAPSEASNT